jgi:hypothetical protein
MQRDDAERARTYTNMGVALWEVGAIDRSLDAYLAALNHSRLLQNSCVVIL